MTRVQTCALPIYASAAAYADRVVFLADGRIVDELADPTAAAVFDRMKTLGD